MALCLIVSFQYRAPQSIGLIEIGRVPDSLTYQCCVFDREVGCLAYEHMSCVEVPQNSQIDMETETIFITGGVHKTSLETPTRHLHIH
jgi:hypothetical protein